MTSTNLPEAAARAKQILRFYDTIPAMDQQAFTAGFVEMLSIYPLAVVDRAASPSRGLAAYVTYPNLAKFKQLLDEWHAEHVDDLKRRGLLRQSRAGSVRLVPPPGSDLAPVPGDLANVFVPADNPRYSALIKWSETASSREWRFGLSSDGRAGIWVSLNAWDRRQTSMRSVFEAAKPLTSPQEAAE